MSADSTAGPSAPEGADLTDLFLEHAACGGEIDVVSSEPGTLVVRCTGCGRTIEHALPGVAEAAASAASAVPAAAPTPSLEAPAERRREKAPEPAAATVAAVANEDDSEPPLAVGVPGFMGELPPRPSRVRTVFPVLLGLAFLAAALLVANSISDDGPATETADVPAAAEAPDGSAAGEGGRPGGGGAGAGEPEGAGPAEKGSQPGGKDKSDKQADRGAGKQESTPAGGRDPRGIDLNYAVVRGDIRVGLPREWQQRGVTSNGAVQYGPSDNTVAVQVFYELGASRTSAEFAARARQFIRDRRDDARPKQPVIDGNEARIRSPYGSGVELARTVIDGDLHAMVIATIPNAAPPQREAEAEAVIESVSAP